MGHHGNHGSEANDAQQRRLAETADRMELTELLHRYAHAIDSGHLELLEDVFTADATIDFGSVDQYVEGDSVVRGLPTIRAWFEKALAPFPGVLHFMTNHRIELDGDEATTETLMQVLHISMGGIYRGHAVRTKAGWRFDRFSLEERSFEEAAARLTAHMQAVESGSVSPARPEMKPGTKAGVGAAAAAGASPDARSRTGKAEAILDQVFTPAWRNHGGGIPVKTPAGEAFAKLAVEHCYADSWARGGRFDVKQRSLFTLVALATLGCTDELKLHIRGALNLGHAPDDIAELFVQILPYVGTPKMVQAMRLAGEVFREAGV
ncbi:MAG: nuclear transport factor 2 family protein [Deltaproteobacteria bacterium]|nr:nuclear transport factor 2 family protein [Deltaproteobacteria bacterium]